MVTIESWFGSFVVKSFVSRLWSLSLSTSQPCYKINCAKHNEKWSYVRSTHLWTYLLQEWMLGDIFSLVLNFTLWTDARSQSVWSISYGLWIFIYVFCSKFVFWRKLILRAFKVQWYIQTIVTLKTIVDHCPQNFEKPSKNHWYQWLSPQKNIQWWFSNDVKTIKKPSKSMVAWKKTH